MSRILWMVVVCAVQCWGMSPEEVEDFSNFLLQTSSLDIHVKKGVDPDGLYDEDDIVSDHAWEESGKFEGDLILNDRQRKTIVDTVEGLARNGLTDSTKRWPNNEVIYFIQREHFNGGQVQAIQDGIEELARASCVKFRPYRKGDRDAVVIQGSRRGCFSQVGYQGGYQVLNLSGRHPVGRGCFRHGTVVHEMLHTLGFYHMQSSPDRDDYIDVVWANIVQPARHNFRKYNSFSVSDFGVGYDYDSVLHYSRKAFSSNGQDTLVPKMSGAEIGQRVGLSDKDTQKLNKMYCDADNDAVLADENSPEKPKTKKKKPKNQPFQGHGIGYHQGKTVVIKLPAAETYKLRNVPSTDVFDFSKTPQVVSTSEAEGHRFGKEIITYPYTPFTSLNKETITKQQSNYGISPTLNIKTEKQQPDDDTVETSKDSNDGYSLSQYSDEVKPKYGSIDNNDKDLHNSYLQIAKEVKQRIYPQDQGYSYKISKDYSTFYTPVTSEETDIYQDSPHGRFGSYNPISMLHKDKNKTKVELIKNADDVLNKNSQFDHRMDHSYRTSLPTKKPYSSYEQTETPPYATLEYLKNRHDFSNIYSLKTPEGNEDWANGHTNMEENQKRDNIKIDPYIQQSFYTSNIKDDDSKNGEKYILKEEFDKNIKPSRYVLPVKPNIDQSDSIGKQLQVPMDEYSSAILLPTKKPYSAYEQTEMPKYATLEYLKDRHDISGVYKPKENDYSSRKVYDNEHTNDSPPSKNEWREKSPHRDRPAHNRDSNSYYDNDTKDRLAGLVFDENVDKDEQPIQSPKKHQPYQTGEYDEDFYSDYVKPKFENSDISGESPQSNIGSDYERYFKVYEKDDSDPRYTSGEEQISGRVIKNNNSKQSPLGYGDDRYAEYEGRDRRIPAFYESSDQNKRGSRSQDYTLYSAPVPITKDYKKRR